MNKFNSPPIGQACQKLFRRLAIVGVLVLAMKNVSVPPSLNATRAQERSKALAETHAAAESEVNSYAKIDGPKGIYRLKVSQAVTLMEQMYRTNPEGARTNLPWQLDHRFRHRQAQRRSGHPTAGRLR